MENWDAQKMLDLYIHDYMIRKNMHEAAETFAEEANLNSDKAVALNPPDGFLTEWWSLFWDVYSARLESNSNAGGSSSMAADIVPQNIYPNMPMPEPDTNFMLQSVAPTIANPGPSNVIPTNTPTIRPMRDMNLNRSGKAPVLDLDFRQGQSFTEFLAARTLEQERLKLSAEEVSSNSRLFNVEQLACMLPAIGTSSDPPVKVENNLMLPTKREDESGSSMRRSTDVEPTNRPNIIQLMREPTGRAKMHNDDQVARTSAKPSLSSFGSSINMASPYVVGDCSKGIGSMSGMNEEREKPMDVDVETFFSNDKAQEDLGISFGTSQPSSSAQYKTEQQGFPFQLIENFHPTINQLSCCDFSTSGTFFAAGGLAKKVYLWNLRNQSEVTIEGHSQLITDIRFKPDSNFFATTSLNRTVQIWDAANPNRALLNLVGHAAHVVSLDFHPKNTSILCSSDSNDVIRLWRVDQAASNRTLKGANGKIRFQPRHGNLLAAAWRNVINLIDVETGIIQHQFEGHAYDVHSLCWDVEGKCLVSVSDDSARIWSTVAGGKCVHQLYSGGNKFASCTFHPGYAQVVLVGSYQMIDIWNPMMGNKPWTYRAHNGVVSALSHASETKVIGSVSHDQYVRLWK